MAGPAFAFGVRANYVEIAAWDTGYQAQYTISNDGPGSVTKWTVAFDLPTSHTISSSWDSVLARSGQHLVFNNAAWNGELAPGASTTFGFVVVGLTRPASCTINGGPCDTLPALAEIRPPGRIDPIASRRTSEQVRAASAPAPSPARSPRRERAFRRGRTTARREMRRRRSMFRG